MYNFNEYGSTIEARKRIFQRRVKKSFLINSVLTRVQHGFMTRETASKIILMIRSGSVFSKEGLDLLQKAMK